MRRRDCVALLLFAAGIGIRGRLAAVPRTLGFGRRRRRQATGALGRRQGNQCRLDSGDPRACRSRRRWCGATGSLSPRPSPATPIRRFDSGSYGDTDPVNDKSPHQWKVFALDKKTGKDFLGADGVPRHAEDQAAPEVVAGLADAGDRRQGGGGVFRLRGAVRLFGGRQAALEEGSRACRTPGWFFDPDSEWGAASSPVIHKNSVIVQCDRQKDSFIAAFDLKDGKELWRTARAEIPTWGTPTLVDGKDRMEVATNGTKAIRGYDADTGKELWTLGPNSEVTCTTPVSGHGLIFVTAGYPPVQPIYAIKVGSSGDLTLKDGKESSDAIAWSKQRGGVYLPSPIVYGDLLYTVNNNGVLIGV